MNRLLTPDEFDRLMEADYWKCMAEQEKKPDKDSIPPPPPEPPPPPPDEQE